MEYSIDFSGCKYIYQIHAILKKAFHFPDYYGENWDAFWDCLSDLYLNCSKQDTIVIRVTGMRSVPKDLQAELQNMLDCIHDLEPHFGGAHIELEIM